MFQSLTFPIHQIETGNNSTVSEIEAPEVIEAVITVSPEITHEEVLQPVEQPITDEVNTNEILAPPSQAPPLEFDLESHSADPVPAESPPQELPQSEIIEPETIDQEEESPEQGSAQPEEQQTPNTKTQKKRRRKGKIPEFQEDNNIDDDFASRLDMTCIEGTVAPTVNDAYIVEYIRY